MNVINKVPFLKMLTEEERTHLALLSREVEIVKGEDIANSDNIYILMSGSCIVEFENAKKIACEKGYSFIQVKTVQMGKYEDYDKTNETIPQIV